MEKNYEKIFAPCRVYDDKDKTEYNYRLYIPAEYNKKAPLPLIMALHGGGNRGTDNVSQLSQIQVTYWAEMMENGEIEPCIVAAPQLPPQYGFFMDSNCVFAVLNDVCKNYKVDESRVYLTGTSMGGMGSWSSASFAPERFAGVLASAGVYPPARFTFPVGKIAPAFEGDVQCVPVGESEYLPAMRRYAAALQNMPIRNFHSEADAMSPAGFSRIMEKCMEEAGGTDFAFTYFPEQEGISHGETYKEIIEKYPQALKWLLEQRKK